MLAQLEAAYPKDLRLVFRQYPLNIHDKATLAVQAAETAGLQDKFWEMHDLLFAKQSEWAGLSVEQFQAWLVEQAGTLGLDTQKFSNDLASEAIVNLAKEAFDKNSKIGIPYTPFVVINGEQYQGPLDLPNLLAVVQALLLEKRQFTECPPMTIDPAKKYIAVLSTEKGNITLELYAAKAPLAVNSFVFLARQGWFNGVTFHRVLPGFVAQGGDPSGTGLGGPGYVFDNEISSDLKFDGSGVVGMANAGPGTNGSQFFITYAPAPQLDGKYTIFAHVIAGMDVVEKLTPRDPSQSMDLPPGDKILSVTIEEQ